MKSLKKIVIIMVTFFISITVVMQVFYYSNYNTILVLRTENYLKAAVNNAQKQINKELDSLGKISSVIMDNKTVKDYLSGNSADYNAVSSLLFSMASSYPETISNVSLLDTSGNITSSTDINNIYLNSILSDYDIAAFSYNFSFFTKCYFDKSTDKSYFARITPVFSDGSFAQQRIGSAIVISNTTQYQSMIDSLGLPQGSLFFISDNEDTIIVSSVPSMIGLTRYEILSDTGLVNNDSYDEVNYNGSASRIQSGFLIDPEWRTFTIIPISAVNADYSQIGIMGFVIGITTATLLIILSIFLLNNITRPISKIAQELVIIGKDYTNKRIQIESSNEIGRIADDINAMLDRISRITQENLDAQKNLYIAELARHQANFIALQSQINPHFLYNTLECIRSIAEFYDVGEISKISTAMANIFRYAIKERQYVQIVDEMKCIHDYFSIISIRYDGRFTLLTDIKPEVLSKEINKMILQPIVENAVYHGLEPKEGDGFVEIIGFIKDEQTVEIHIKDNGIGIDTCTLSLLQELLNSDIDFEKMNFSSFEKRSIGLLNINIRMKMNYPDCYSMTIESTENKGTNVVIRYRPNRKEY